MRSAITFNGVSSRDLGLIVERVPNSDRPVRKADVYSVPGRNGDIIVPQNAWENVEQSYTVWGGRARGGAVAVGYKIAEWLYAPEGYQRLTDTFDPEHYRLAAFLGPLDLENFLTRQARAEISFTCDPRRFLVSGDEVIPAGAVENPTAFVAKPTITVYGSGSGTITAGGNTLEIAGIYDGMVIDCESMTAYSGTENLNNLISGAFPVIPAGEQEVTITGGIESLDIIPRWWTL